MLIDWYTVVAQLLNFVVLLFLLKRFLYGPILRAVAGREERIAATFEEAERDREEAKRLAEELDEKRRELDGERDRCLEKAKEEAAQRREELLKKAKEEAGAVREAWREALRSEKDRFFAEFRRRAGAEVLRIGRRAFTDLAGEDLDERIVEAFLAKIDGIGKKQKEVFRNEESGGVAIMTRAELTAPLRKRVTAGVHRAAGRDVDVRYDTDPGMSPGIRLDSGDTRLSWNVGDYFDAMEGYLCEALDVPEGECRGEASSS